MATQTSFGSVKNLHLTRAARSAGEAFAFSEPEATVPANRSLSVSLLGIVLAVVVALAVISLL